MGNKTSAPQLQNSNSKNVIVQKPSFPFTFPLTANGQVDLDVFISKLSFEDENIDKQIRRLFSVGDKSAVRHEELSRLVVPLLTTPDSVLLENCGKASDNEVASIARMLFAFYMPHSASQFGIPPISEFKCLSSLSIHNIDDQLPLLTSRSASQGISSSLRYALQHCGRKERCHNFISPPIPLKLDGTILTQSRVLLLSLQNSWLSNAEKWFPLFSLRSDGRSFVRFVSKVNHYSAPCVLLLSSGSNVLGAYLSKGFEEKAHKYYGDSESYIFALSPHFNIFRSSRFGTNFCYLNNSNKYETMGLGFGGQQGFFRMFISKDMQTVKTSQSDSSYSEGVLLSEVKTEQTTEGFIELELDELEVWGTGTVADLENQFAAREREENVRQERRQVDKSKLADNEFNREFLLDSGFKQGGDRAGEAKQIAEDRRREMETKTTNK